MFCRFCGKNIADNSSFCRFCGKKLIDETYKSTDIKTHSTLHNLYKNAFAFLHKNISSIVKIFSYAALVVYLLLNMLMAPFYGFAKSLAYLISAIVAVLLTIFTKRIIAKCDSLKIKLLSILSSSLIIIFSLILSSMYIIKVNDFVNDFSGVEKIIVDTSHNVKYYSKYNPTIIYENNEHANIKLDGKNTSKTNTFFLEKPMNLELECIVNGTKNTLNDTIIFYPYNFENGEYTVIKSIDIDYNLSATVEITFKRICSFWDVIFY